MPSVNQTRRQVRHLVAPDLGDQWLGECTAAAATTITDNIRMIGFGDDFFNNHNMRLTIYEGTGAGQSRLITDYVSATGVITVDTWTTNPTATAPISKFEIHSVASGWPTFEEYNAAINTALLQIGTQALVSQNDTFICTQRDRHIYPIPVPDFKEITGTADSGSTTTLLDDTLIGYGDDYFNGDELVFESGTGAGQRLRITDFASSTGTITFATATAPDTTTTYRIIRRAKAPRFVAIKLLGEVRGAVGGDRHYSYDYNSGQNFRAAAGNARIAQGFQIAGGRGVDGDWYSAVWVALRRIDFPTGDLIAELQTNSSGTPPDTTPVFVDDPSGTQVGPYSVRVNIADIPTDFTFIRFKFVRPVFLAYNTTYHIVLRGADNDTTATANYLQVAVDTNGQYSYGNLSTGTSTPTWTAVAGTDVIFRLEPTAFEETELPADSWEILRGERQIRFKAQPRDGMIIRVMGQRTPELANADGAPLEVNAGDLAAIVAERLVRNIPQQGPAGKQINASVITQLGEQAKRNLIVPILKGAKQVEVG